MRLWRLTCRLRLMRPMPRSVRRPMRRHAASLPIGVGRSRCGQLHRRAVDIARHSRTSRRARLSSRQRRRGMLPAQCSRNPLDLLIVSERRQADERHRVLAERIAERLPMLSRGHAFRERPFWTATLWRASRLAARPNPGDLRMSTRPDKADSASGRLISSLRRSSSALVGARESCGPEMNGSVSRQSVSRNRDRVAPRLASRRVAHASPKPPPRRSRRSSLPAKLRSHRVHARSAAPLGLADERFP